MSWVRREMTVMEQKTAREGKVSKRSRPTRNVYIVKFNDGTEWTGGREVLELEFVPYGKAVEKPERSGVDKAVAALRGYLEAEDAQMNLLLVALGHLGAPARLADTVVGKEAYQANRRDAAATIAHALEKKANQVNAIGYALQKLGRVAEFEKFQRGQR